MKQMRWDHIIFWAVLLFSVMKLLTVPIALGHLAISSDHRPNQVLSHASTELILFFARQLGMAALATILVAIFSIFLTALLALPAAYAFVVFEFRGKTFLWACMIIMLFLPSRLAVLNITKSLKLVGINEPHLIMVVCYTTEVLPFAILLGAFFVRSLPNALFKWQSLYIRSETLIFWHTVTPILKKWIIFVGLTSLYIIWGDIWTPTLVAGKPILFAATFIEFLRHSAIPGGNEFVVIIPALIPSAIIFIAFMWQIHTILKLSRGPIVSITS